MAAAPSSAGGRRMKEDILPPLVEGDHASYLTAINQKLSTVKEDIHETIKDNLGLVMETLDHTTHLSRQVARVQSELKHVRARVSDPQNSLFSVLISSAKHRRQLMEQERHTGVLIKVLESLVEAHKAVTRLDELIQQGNIIASLRQRRKLSVLISSLPGAFSDNKEPIIYTTIKQEFAKLDNQLTQQLQEAFRASLSFDVEKRALSILTPLPFIPLPDLRASSAPEESETPYHLSLATTLVCLDQLGLAKAQLPAVASTLCSFIDSFLVDPSNGIHVTGFTASSQVTHAQLTVTEAKRKSEPLQLITASLNSIITFLEFITEHIVSPLFQEFLRLDLTGEKDAKTATPQVSPATQLVQLLGEHLLPHIMDRLIRCCFEPSIPEQSSQLDEYQKRVSTEVDRFMPLLNNFTWLHYDPTPNAPVSIMTPNEDILNTTATSGGIAKLVSYLKDTRLHFALNKRRIVLTRARELLLSSVYTSTIVGTMDLGSSEMNGDSRASVSSNTGLGVAIFKFPQCRVRDVVIELVEMVHKLWEDAARNSNASDSLHLGDTTSSQPIHIQSILIETARDILDLYRSIVPSLEQSKITKIPSLSMLFHNDCNYMAHHAALIGAKYRFMLQATHSDTDQASSPAVKTLEIPVHMPSSQRHSASLSATPSSSSASVSSSTTPLLNPLKSAMPTARPIQGPLHSFIDLVPSFRSLAEQFYGSIVSEVEDSLNAALERTGNLVNSHLEENKQRCLTACRRVRADLESMDLMWRDTLPKELHKVTMGYLVNQVTRWMVETAIKIDDYGAEETDSLNLIFSSLFPLARLFVDVIDTSSLSAEKDTKNACAKYVKSWLKFEDLADIFRLSMVDIVAHYNEFGFDFTREEMVQLMLALFSDTPKRKGCINSLRSEPLQANSR